ncbi:hypothetical protein GPJ56_009383 [Histomonas meleagridis]|uniref:uncharacterized protein n=1 Tax=Histomonas meleagridis TaxID=135588 RepID=UPI00355A75A2|nr:hypothetical protein GPJ56_009383 [Histomonas meleagridis]KAH0797513.1 hypothetical protein GO595_009834 [Histomonas meleagridis]
MQPQGIPDEVMNCIKKMEQELALWNADKEERKRGIEKYYKELEIYQKNCNIDEEALNFLIQKSFSIGRYSGFNGLFAHSISIIIKTPEARNALISFCMKEGNDVPYYSAYDIAAFIRNIEDLPIGMKVSDFFEQFSGKKVSKEFMPLIDQLSDIIEPIYPDLISQINVERTKAAKIVESSIRNAYIPIVEHVDSTDPRVSKFGGKMPFLATKQDHICKKCQNNFSPIFSLYIKNLPDDIQALFPEEDRDSVLVGYGCLYCNELYEDCFACLYHKEEIDQITYGEVDHKYVLNESRVVTGWEKVEMYPLSSDSINLDYELDKVDKYFIGKILNTKYTKELEKKMKTYLGGYPIFCRGDYQPENTILLMELMQSEASTADWGELVNLGTGQVWMTTGENYGEFYITLN